MEPVSSVAVQSSCPFISFSVSVLLPPDTAASADDAEHKELVLLSYCRLLGDSGVTQCYNGLSAAS